MSKQGSPHFQATQHGNAPPKYLNDFTKALAGEVRILLEEVGKLRDERRQLQSEIAELMALKSKHSAGGEYAPIGWVPPPEEAPAEEAPAEEALAPAKPAWRTVHKRKERVPKQITNGPAAGGATPRAAAKQIAAAPAPAAAPPPPSLPAWAQWRPNPGLAMPSPQQPSLAVAVPTRPGLFGPPSPPA